MATVGYRRVSTLDQSTKRQLADCWDSFDERFEDYCSGRSIKRPGLENCLRYLHPGDELHIQSFDRLARGLRDLLDIVDTLKKKKTALIIHDPQSLIKRIGPNDDDPQQRLMLQLLGAMAEFERALILERQREGIAVAKAAGKYRGGQYRLTAEQANELRRLRATGARATDLARQFGVSRSAVYSYFQPDYLTQKMAKA